MSAAVLEPEERIHEVHIEGLALLKIVKHCHESLPHMVSGSLLGLGVGNGVLEITHAFPLPAGSDHHKQADKGDADDDAALTESEQFQMEMMRMLREVNVDYNCVGWYQSMYLGIYSTSSLLENQFSYQMDLSPNAVVVLYDPMQTAHGNLTLQCYRLTEECLRMKADNINAYINPKNIFERVPVKLTNPGLARVLLADLAVAGSDAPRLAQDDDDGLYDVHADTAFDRLDLSTNPYLEKHLEFLCTWVDDLAAEQHKFQYYSRQLARGGASRSDDTNKKSEGGTSWASSDAPRRMESLLITNQIRSYCDQMDHFASDGLSKLYLTGGLHKE